MISVIIATGRPEFGSLMSGKPGEHLFDRTLTSLETQTNQEFELIVVDSCSAIRDLSKGLKERTTLPFKLVSNDSFWLAEGCWGLQRAFNKGAEASSGDWLLFCGDCCEFPPDTFERAKEYLQQGYTPHLLHVYKMGDTLSIAIGSMVPSRYSSVDEARKFGAFNDTIVRRDSRFRYCETNVLYPPQCGYAWHYGYCFVLRDDFFALNGWEELFDGEKSYGDIELGSRLQKANRWRMVLDPDLIVYEHQHYGIDAQVFYDFDRSGLALKSNWDLLLYMRESGNVVANQTKLSEVDCWRIIRAELSGLKDWPEYLPTAQSEQARLQRLWMANQPHYWLHDSRNSDS